MQFAAEHVVGLAKALAWPAVALVTLVALRDAIGETLRGLGRRATKLSVFKVEIELSRLDEARPGLVAAVENLREQVAFESRPAPVAAGVIASGGADYLVVSLGAGTGRQAWLTSRLFLLAALLERGGARRCIAFKDPDGAFVGAATPRATRAALGAVRPEYEEAFALALSAALNQFAGVALVGTQLSDAAVEAITRGFLQSPAVVMPHGPAHPGNGWTLIERPNSASTWERADWVRPGTLLALLRGRISADSVKQSPAGGGDTGKLVRAIVGKHGDFVALLDAKGSFAGLYDRREILESVARNAAAQSETP